MSAGLGGVITGLPSLLGVLLGIRAYTGGSPWAFACLGLIVGAFLAMQVGKALLHKTPQLGAWVIETWIFAAVGITALTTLFIIWIALSPLPEFLGTVSDTDASKVSAAFVAAFTTYLAVAWTKDISDAKGYFWPSTQFKDGLKRAYGRLPRKPEGTSAAYEAMFEDFVSGHDVRGWGFSARRKRAKMLSDFL